MCKNLQHFQILALWVGVDKIYNRLWPNNSLTWYIVHKYKAMLPISIVIVTFIHTYHYVNLKTVMYVSLSLEFANLTIYTTNC